MDITTIPQLITNVGFPIFCVLMLGLYIYKREGIAREERKQTQDMLMNFSLNLQENTHALQNLSELIKDNRNANNDWFN